MTKTLYILPDIFSNTRDTDSFHLSHDAVTRLEQQPEESLVSCISAGDTDSVFNWRQIGLVLREIDAIVSADETEATIRRELIELHQFISERTNNGTPRNNTYILVLAD